MPVIRSLAPAALVALCLALAGPGLALASDLEPVSAAPDVVVTIDADGLHPRDTRIIAGQVVEWRNADGERHRMRSRSGPARFDSGNIETGERYRIRFTAAGTYPYVDARDEDDSTWHGRIVVVAGETQAGTDATPATPASADATVVLGDDFVDPANVRIAVGGSVTFRNQGEDEHTATSTDGGPIDSGVLVGGASQRTSFPDAGEFAFVCIFHSEMRGTVSVVASDDPAGASPTPAPAAATPDPTPPPPEPATTAPDAVQVEAADLEFRAPAVTVAVGGLVSWTNVGQAPHTVTASDGSFDSGIVEPGAGFEQRFEAAGTYAYLCELHPGMAGTVEVVATEPGSAEVVPGAPVVGGGTDPTAPPIAPAGDGEVVSTSALGDLAGLILAVTAVSAAVTLFAKLIGGTVRPVTTYKPE